MEEKVLVGVYDQLRRQGNAFSSYLNDAAYVATYYTEPIFDMYAMNSSYPGIRRGGSSSILLEVFEISESDLKVTDYYEGFSEYNPYQNVYDRIEIETPFGPCFVYEYSKPIFSKPLVEEGDWFKYKKRLRDKVSNIINEDPPRWGVD